MVNYYYEGGKWRVKLDQRKPSSNLHDLQRKVNVIMQAFYNDPIEFRKRMVVWTNRNRKIKQDMAGSPRTLQEEDQQMVGRILPTGCCCNRRMGSKSFIHDTSFEDMERSLSLLSRDKERKPTRNTTKEDYHYKQLHHGTMLSQHTRSRAFEEEIQGYTLPDTNTSDICTGLQLEQYSG